MNPILSMQGGIRESDGAFQSSAFVFLGNQNCDKRFAPWAGGPRGVVVQALTKNNTGPSPSPRPCLTNAKTNSLWSLQDLLACPRIRYGLLTSSVSVKANNWLGLTFYSPLGVWFLSLSPSTNTSSSVVRNTGRMKILHYLLAAYFHSERRWGKFFALAEIKCRPLNQCSPFPLSSKMPPTTSRHDEASQAILAKEVQTQVSCPRSLRQGLLHRGKLLASRICSFGV